MASQVCYDSKVLNNEQYDDIKQEILKSQEEYRNMNLTSEQRSTIDWLIKDNAELYEEGMAAAYRQGLFDCVSLLQDLGIIKI